MDNILDLINVENFQNIQISTISNHILNCGKIKINNAIFCIFTLKQFCSNNNYPLDLIEPILVNLLLIYDYELKTAANLIHLHKDCENSVSIYLLALYWFMSGIACVRIANIILKYPKFLIDNYKTLKTYIKLYNNSSDTNRLFHRAYNLLINNNDKESIFVLAYMYECGNYLTIDNREAWKLYVKSALLGEPRAIVNMASMLIMGIYVQENMQFAYQLYLILEKEYIKSKNYIISQQIIYNHVYDKVKIAINEMETIFNYSQKVDMTLQDIIDKVTVL